MKGGWYRSRKRRRCGCDTVVTLQLRTWKEPCRSRFDGARQGRHCHRSMRKDVLMKGRPDHRRIGGPVFLLRRENTGKTALTSNATLWKWKFMILICSSPERQNPITGQKYCSAISHMFLRAGRASLSMVSSGTALGGVSVVSSFFPDSFITEHLFCNRSEHRIDITVRRIGFVPSEKVGRTGTQAHSSLKHLSILSHRHKVKLKMRSMKKP